MGRLHEQEMFSLMPPLLDMIWTLIEIHHASIVFVCFVRVRILRLLHFTVYTVYTVESPSLRGPVIGIGWKQLFVAEMDMGPLDDALFVWFQIESLHMFRHRLGPTGRPYCWVAGCEVKSVHFSVVFVSIHTFKTLKTFLIGSSPRQNRSRCRFLT